MSTGDIKNNLRKLQNELKQIQYMNEIDFEKMMIGLSAPFLPILHYVFTEYSCELSSFFANKGYDLYAKSDFRFLEIIYKILIQEFDTKAMLTKQQFFSIGYPEMKVIFTTKIISLCRQKHESITKKSIKKKKKSTSSIKFSNTQNNLVEDEKPDQVHFERETALPDNIQAVGVEFDEVSNGDVMPKPLLPSEHKVKPPRPIPELALSPVKSQNDESKYEDNEGMREIDSRLLDLTEIGEESFVEMGEVEVIDIENEKYTMLPEFTITKHSNELQNVKVTTSDWPIPFGSWETEPEDNQRVPQAKHVFPDGHSLPSNISVVSPLPKKLPLQNRLSRDCEPCPQCAVNSTMIKTLFENFEVMQKDIQNLITVNNDLSAKVVLLETRQKITENCTERSNVSSDNAESYHVDEDKCVDDVKNDFYPYHEKLDNSVECLDLREDVPRSFPPVNNPVICNIRSTAPTPANPENSYSPIKYTDDDIIIKDFKPIRMKDVHDMMNKANLEDNKENDGMLSQAKHIKVRKEPFAMKKIDDCRQKDESAGLQCNDDTDDIFPGSCDVSKLEDDATEQAVRNVRKRLQETEKMLRDSGSLAVTRNLVK